MTLSHVRNVAVVSLVAACLLLVAGCAKKSAGPSVVLGPKPASYAGERAHESQMVDNMRAWLESLSRQDAETLRTTGQTVFGYEALRQSDPTHAQMVSQYTSDTEARARASGMIEKMRARGMAAPDFTIQSVSFAAMRAPDGKPMPGAYKCSIEYGGGVSNLILSEPL